MKIALVSFSFYESTLPLAKHLAEIHEVTLYCCFSARHLNPPMIDISDKELKPFINHPESSNMLPASVTEYLGKSTLKIMMVVNSTSIYDFKTPVFLSNELKRNNYDLIHIIGHHVSFYQLHFLLRKQRVVHSLHEGDIARVKEKNFLKNFLFDRLFNWLRSDRIEVIFHSENTRDAYLKTYKKDKAGIHVIPFGLFEIYNYMKPSAEFNFSGESFKVLYFGYILPYKGVDILLKAIDIYNSKYSGKINFIIAGKDGIGINKDHLPKNVTLINKFLKEEEIASLVMSANCVVLPYKEVSQSGIPNVVYCFKKPIIASDLPGLNNVIKEMGNGLLFKCGDSDQLAEKINLMSDSKEIETAIVENIRKNRTNIPSWSLISKVTESVYMKMKNNKL